MKLYKADVLEALAICWCRLTDEEASNDATAVKAALKDSVNLLTAVAADEGIDADAQVLISSDERLVDLFSPARV